LLLLGWGTGSGNDKVLAGIEEAATAAAAATKRFVLTEAKGAVAPPLGPLPPEELSEVFLGRPGVRLGGEELPLISGFLKAAAAAFLVNRTAVLRFTPEGEPVKLLLEEGVVPDFTGVTGVNATLDRRS